MLLLDRIIGTSTRESVALLAVNATTVQRMFVHRNVPVSQLRAHERLHDFFTSRADSVCDGMTCLR